MSVLRELGVERMGHNLLSVVRRSHGAQGSRMIAFPVRCKVRAMMLEGYLWRSVCLTLRLRDDQLAEVIREEFQ